MRSGGSGVVDNGHVALNPSPASIFGQKSVILGTGLSFSKHCKNQYSDIIFFQDKNKSSASNLSSELYLVLVASKQGKPKKSFLKILLLVYHEF